MNLWSISHEKIEDLKEEVNKKEKELKLLKDKTIEVNFLGKIYSIYDSKCGQRS